MQKRENNPLKKAQKAEYEKFFAKLFSKKAGDWLSW